MCTLVCTTILYLKYICAKSVECSGSGVELQTLDLEDLGLNPVLKPCASFFTLHCSSSISCINEYLAVDSGGYVYEHSLRINYSIWVDASQRS